MEESSNQIISIVRKMFVNAGLPEDQPLSTLVSGSDQGSLTLREMNNIKYFYSFNKTPFPWPICRDSA